MNDSQQLKRGQVALSEAASDSTQPSGSAGPVVPSGRCKGLACKVDLRHRDAGL